MFRGRVQSQACNYIYSSLLQACHDFKDFGIIVFLSGRMW